MCMSIVRLLCWKITKLWGLKPDPLPASATVSQSGRGQMAAILGFFTFFSKFVFFLCSRTYFSYLHAKFQLIMLRNEYSALYWNFLQWPVFICWEMNIYAFLYSQGYVKNDWLLIHYTSVAPMDKFRQLRLSMSKHYVDEPLWRDSHPMQSLSMQMSWHQFYFRLPGTTMLTA